MQIQVIPSGQLPKMVEERFEMVSTALAGRGDCRPIATPSWAIVKKRGELAQLLGLVQTLSV